VGKTELAKALANLLFDDEKMMVSHPSTVQSHGDTYKGIVTWFCHSLVLVVVVEVVVVLPHTCSRSVCSQLNMVQCELKTRDSFLHE
jgi:hypothetical protein